MKQYKHHIAKLGRKAFTEQAFADELVRANLRSPSAASNGVQLLPEGSLDNLVDHIASVSGAGANVCLLVLCPDGMPLTPVR